MHLSGVITDEPHCVNADLLSLFGSDVVSSGLITKSFRIVTVLTELLKLLVLVTL